MKRMILITLCAAMLCMAGTSVTASAACGLHNYRETGGYWVYSGYGYDHPYTGSDGITHGCSVTVYRWISIKFCTECGFVTQEETDNYDHRHSVAGH